MKVTIPNRFTPRDYQARFMKFFDQGDPGGKRAVWVAHRRSGKDLTSMHQTCKMMLQRVGTYWHIFPTAEQGRRAIWTEFTRDGDRIMEQVFPTAIRKLPKTWAPNAEMIVELKNGAIWRLMGSDKIEVVGAGPVGVVFSEFALAKPKTWDYVRPMLRERNGWAAFVSTPRGRNHLWNQWEIAEREGEPAWWRQIDTIETTNALPLETVEQERRDGMPDNLIRQEYFCDWTAANVGAVWGAQLELMEKTGGVLEFDHPNDGVYTSWDLGVSDSTAIWFWRLNEKRMPDLIDHYEASGQSASHYFSVLESKPYKYVRHYLPHDARQRSWQTGVGVIDQFISRWGADKVTIGPELSLRDGIQAGRWLLEQPMRIHTRCGSGIDALREYRYEYDEELKVFSTRPLHNWASHSADAFRYLAQVVRHTDLVTRQKVAQPLVHTRPSMDDLWKEHERNRRRMA